MANRLCEYKICGWIIFSTLMVFLSIYLYSYSLRVCITTFLVKCFLLLAFPLLNTQLLFISYSEPLFFLYSLPCAYILVLIFSYAYILVLMYIQYSLFSILELIFSYTFILFLPLELISSSLCLYSFPCAYYFSFFISLLFSLLPFSLLPVLMMLILCSDL